jgi:hypothetical protein
MKKTLREIKLHTETLRKLGSSDLREVAGGSIIGISCPTKPTATCCLCSAPC